MKGITGAALVAVGLLAAAVPAAAVTSVADWQMDEPPGATVAVDSASGINGQIGDKIETGQTDGTSTWYHWNRPQSFPEEGHLVILPSGDALNPGTRNWRIEADVRTNIAWPNIVQKGEAGDATRWKLELAGGNLHCMFHSTQSNGSVRLWRFKVNDGQWHRLGCTRYPDRIVATIGDPDHPLYEHTIYTTTGNIANTKHATIGGKYFCPGNPPTDHDCDYFVGDIDWVRVGVP
jgi:hypothetical protein